VPLPQLSGVNPDLFDTKNIYKNFSTEDALWIKETERNQPRCKSTLSKTLLKN
jgi:hypothetical protein